MSLPPPSETHAGSIRISRQGPEHAAESPRPRWGKRSRALERPRPEQRHALPDRGLRPWGDGPYSHRFHRHVPVEEPSAERHAE